MSKLTHIDRFQIAKSPVFFALNGPALPNYQKQPATEKKGSDPSSMQPGGLSYPIPSFFDYRAKAKEYDSM